MNDTYQNFRVVFNTYIGDYTIALVKYDKDGTPLKPYSPVLVLGQTLEEAKENLESLLYDIEHHEKEVLVIKQDD